MSPAADGALLALHGVEASYDQTKVLFDVSLQVREGAVTTLLGRNGVGKSTIVKTIMGVVRARAGTIHFGGRAIQATPSHDIARQGIGLVPEGRRVIAALTVEENLVAFAANRLRRPSAWTLDRVYALLPRLRERARSLGRTLSGGEQQMLAIGRALMTNPKLIILDEATEGLAPLIRQEIWSALQVLKQDGLSILVIDKELGALLSLADAHFIVERGRIVWSGSSQDFRDDESRLHGYLSL